MGRARVDYVLRPPDIVCGVIKSGQIMPVYAITLDKYFIVFRFVGVRCEL
jgi:hypothetical protein